MSDEFANEGSVPVKPESTSEEGAPAEGGEDQLNIKVTDSQTEVHFRVKPKTVLRRVMDTFCRRTGKDPNSLRFMFDGERISPDDTPASLGMEDKDTIEALNQQTGGAA